MIINKIPWYVKESAQYAQREGHVVAGVEHGLLCQSNVMFQKNLFWYVTYTKESMAAESPGLFNRCKIDNSFNYGSVVVICMVEIEGAKLEKKV